MALQFFTQDEVRAWPVTGDWAIGPNGARWRAHPRAPGNNGGDLSYDTRHERNTPSGGAYDPPGDMDGAPFIEAPGCYIGDNVTMERGIRLGHDCSIGADSYLGDGFFTGGMDFWQIGKPEPAQRNIPGFGLVDYDADWDGWPWTHGTIIGEGNYFDCVHWYVNENGYGQWTGGDCEIAAGTTVGDGNWFGSDCYCWGKPTVGNRNTFKNSELDYDGTPYLETNSRMYSSDCYIWNGAVVGDDNVFGSDAYIGLVYNAQFATGTAPYYGNQMCHDARDFGDASVGNGNTTGQDFYCWGPFEDSASMGDNNLIGEAEFYGSRLSSNWTIAPVYGEDFFFADCTGSSQMKFGDYKQSIVGGLARNPTDWVPPEVVNDIINPKFHDNLDGWGYDSNAGVTRITNPPVAFITGGFINQYEQIACARMTSWRNSSTPDYPLWTIERPLPEPYDGVLTPFLYAQGIMLKNNSGMLPQFPRILFDNGTVAPTEISFTTTGTPPVNQWWRWYIGVTVPVGASSYSIAFGYKNAPIGSYLYVTTTVGANFYTYDVDGDSPGWEWTGDANASRSREIHER